VDARSSGDATTRRLDAEDDTDAPERSGMSGIVGTYSAAPLRFLPFRFSFLRRATAAASFAVIGIGVTSSTVNSTSRADGCSSRQRTCVAV
jgi:hypothetical protein